MDHRASCALKRISVPVNERRVGLDTRKEKPVESFSLEKKVATGTRACEGGAAEDWRKTDGLEKKRWESRLTQKGNKSIHTRVAN